MLNATTDTAKTADSENEQTKVLVLEHLSQTLGLLQSFQKALPNDQTHLIDYISVWLKDTAETVQAMIKLYDKGSILQALAVARMIIETYFTLEWLYEDNEPELRLLLLKYHLLKQYDDYYKNFDEIMVKRGETIIPMPQRQQLADSVQNHLNKILSRYPEKFPNEESVNEATRKIKSYPKIHDTNKSDEYKEDERLYNMLSGAVHPKDLTKQVILDTKEAFYNDSMMLVEACFTVLHLIAFVGKKRSMDMSPFQTEMLKLHQKGEWLFFFRYS